MPLYRRKGGLLTDKNSPIKHKHLILVIFFLRQFSFPNGWPSFIHGPPKRGSIVNRKETRENKVPKLMAQSQEPNNMIVLMIAASKLPKHPWRSPEGCKETQSLGDREEDTGWFFKNENILLHQWSNANSLAPCMMSHTIGKISYGTQSEESYGERQKPKADDPVLWKMCPQFLKSFHLGSVHKPIQHRGNTQEKTGSEILLRCTTHAIQIQASSDIHQYNHRLDEGVSNPHLEIIAVCKLLWKEIIPWFGLRKFLQTDNRPSFAANGNQSLSISQGIQHRLHASWYLQYQELLKSELYPSKSQS